jgi:hypothetical protein
MGNRAQGTGMLSGLASPGVNVPELSWQKIGFNEAPLFFKRRHLCPLILSLFDCIPWLVLAYDIPP